MRAQSQLHVLLGWHRAQKSTTITLIDKWIQEREDAVKAIFMFKILGGKDVFDLMKRNGWFTLAAQIQPIKTTKAIRVSELKNYEPVILITKQKQEDVGFPGLPGAYPYMRKTSGWFAVGMVDNRLNVREAIFQTPRVTCYTKQNWFYYWQDDEKHYTEWLQFLQRLSTRTKHSFPPSNLESSCTLFDRVDRLSTRPIVRNVPVFSEKKRKMNILPHDLNEARMAHLIIKPGPSCFSHEKYLKEDVNRANINYNITCDVLQILLANDPLKISKTPIFTTYNNYE